MTLASKFWKEIKWGAGEALQALGFTLYLIFAVGSIIGPMFGIAWMVDNVNVWCVLLFIPALVLLFPWLKLLTKPFIKWD